MKRLIILGIFLLFTVNIAGCGTQSNISQSNHSTNQPAAMSTDQKNNSAQLSTNQMSNSNSSKSNGGSSDIAQQEAQVQSINIKSAQGQAEVDQKIDQHLQSLDNALNSLDKSAGNL